MLVLWIPGDFLRGGVRGVVGVVTGLRGGGLRGQVVIRVLPRGQHYPNPGSKPALELILWTNTETDYGTHTVSLHTNIKELQELQADDWLKNKRVFQVTDSIASIHVTTQTDLQHTTAL